MMNRTAASVIALTLTLMSAPVFAADGNLEAAAGATTIVAGFDAMGTAVPASSVDWAAPRVAFRAPSSRPTLLPALYISLAALQAYDGYSTSKGLALGGVEGNGSMKAVAGRPMMLWAVKAGATAGAVVIAEQMWKRNNKVGAVALMVAANSVSAIVAAHNVSALKHLR
jgi:hypothetical protein